MANDNLPSNRPSAAGQLTRGVTPAHSDEEIVEASNAYWLAAIIKLAADAVDEDNAGRMIPLAGLTDEQIYDLM